MQVIYHRCNSQTWDWWWTTHHQYTCRWNKKIWQDVVCHSLWVWINSASYEYKNRSASKGAQLVHIGIPMTCWNMTPPLCWLYLEHLVPLLIWILTSCPFNIIWEVLLANARWYLTSWGTYIFIMHAYIFILFLQRCYLRGTQSF